MPIKKTIYITLDSEAIGVKGAAKALAGMLPEPEIEALRNAGGALACDGYKSVDQDSVPGQSYHEIFFELSEQLDELVTCSPAERVEGSSHDPDRYYGYRHEVFWYFLGRCLVEIVYAHETCQEAGDDLVAGTASYFWVDDAGLDDEGHRRLLEKLMRARIAAVARSAIQFAVNRFGDALPADALSSLLEDEARRVSPSA